MARMSSDISKKISLLVYLIPSFLQGMGDANGFVLTLCAEAPVADSILLSNDGGSTMSRNALRSVVRG